MSTHYHPDINILREIVPNVDSWRALALALGLRYPSSTIYHTVRPFCIKNGIDFSHFLGQSHNRGKQFYDKRIKLDEYFSGERKIASHDLKLRLIREGHKQHRCEKCLNTHWNGAKIPIQLHHIDGNSENNAEANLQILCPNCHAQTPTYCGKNIMSEKSSISDEDILSAIPKCKTIGGVLATLNLPMAKSYYSRIRNLMRDNPDVCLSPKLASQTLQKRLNADPNWRNTPKPHLRKHKRPSKEELEILVWSKPSTIIKKERGCSDSLIVKWCRIYGISKPPRGYWKCRSVGMSHEEALKKTGHHQS